MQCIQCRGASCCWVQGVCSDAASFDLSPQVLAGCMQEVKVARDLVIKRRENNDLRSLSNAYGGCGLRVSLQAVPSVIKTLSVTCSPQHLNC